MVGRIGRFQVMALLQAARAVALGLPEDKARSWGLNRAIFYAAAKRGFVGGGRREVPERGRVGGPPQGEEEGRVFRLGEEKAYRRKIKNRLWFVIGSEVQTPEKYTAQIARRFGNEYPVAWREAMGIIRGYPDEVLKSQRRFYEEVYKPRRDVLASQWSRMVGLG